MQVAHCEIQQLTRHPQSVHKHAEIIPSYSYSEFIITSHFILSYLTASDKYSVFKELLTLTSCRVLALSSAFSYVSFTHIQSSAWILPWLLVSERV